MKATVLIADDEAFARRKLREYTSELPWVKEILEAADGLEAVTLLDDREPDIVLLDIQMPELSGIQVLERARHRPVVIFTTAFHRYAVTAFELRAVDYLLKPFGWERFRNAMERARGYLETPPDPELEERVQWALADTGPVTKLFVRDENRILPIPVEAIERLEASGDYVEIHTGGRTHLLQVPLKEVEKRLHPERFVRIHRSHIVNLDFVEALEPREDARLDVLMKGGTRLAASRSRSRILRRLAP